MVDNRQPGLSLSTQEFKALTAAAGKLQSDYQNRRIPTKIDNGRALRLLASADKAVYRCSAGGNLLIILADGDVMPCRRLPFVPGNLEETPLEEPAINSPVMQELRSSEAPLQCRRCPFVGKCRGGAKCVTYAQTGSLLSKDVNCWMPF